MTLIDPADTGTVFICFTGNTVAAFQKEFTVKRGTVFPAGVETGTAENIIKFLLQSGGQKTRLQQLLDNRGIAFTETVETVGLDCPSRRHDPAHSAAADVSLDGQQ